MTKDELYTVIKEQFEKVLKDNNIENDVVKICCRSLSPVEAIGETKRKDFPILTGKDVMIQAEYKGYKGQAFTDAPSEYEGTLQDILKMDIHHNPHDRGLFIACLNAVMRSLNMCCNSVHCRKDGPELCASDMHKYLTRNYPNVKKIALVGYQPALLEMLANSEFEVRVLDLNPANINQVRFGVTVEDGSKVKEEIINEYADLILCTGSTVCNGTIVDYINIRPEVLFFGISATGSAKLLGLKTICFADNYPA